MQLFKSWKTSLLLVLTYLFHPSIVRATTVDNVYQNDVVTLTWVQNMFDKTLGIMVSLIGTGVFLMTVIGAILWLASGGDQKKIEQAKATYTSAFLALALVFGVWFILFFISGFTGNPKVLLFKFGTW